MDSSNAKPLYLRNRIRHQLLPLLKQFNPAVVDALTRQADILRDDDCCLEQWASEWIGRHVQRGDDRSLAVPRMAVLELPVALQRRVIRRVMQQAAQSPYSPTFGSAEAVLEKIVRGRSGSSLALRGASVVREYERVRFFPNRTAGRHAGGVSDRAVSLCLSVPSAIVWPPTEHVIRLSYVLASDGTGDGTGTSAGTQIARFDADRFTHPLVVRSWTAGDVFHPQGMGGRRKKVQDYFCDIKLPRERRAGVPLLVAPEGILWIVGHRADQRFRVTPSTRRILVAEIVPIETSREGKD
jgi:tRNA(Ile)-lysidine synthase